MSLLWELKHTLSRYSDSMASLKLLLVFLRTITLEVAQTRCSILVLPISRSANEMRSKKTSLFIGEVVYDMSPSFSAGRTDPGVLVMAFRRQTHVVGCNTKERLKTWWSPLAKKLRLWPDDRDRHHNMF